MWEGNKWFNFRELLRNINSATCSLKCKLEGKIIFKLTTVCSCQTSGASLILYISAPVIKQKFIFNLFRQKWGLMFPLDSYCKCADNTIKSCLTLVTVSPRPVFTEWNFEWLMSTHALRHSYRLRLNSLTAMLQVVHTRKVKRFRLTGAVSGETHSPQKTLHTDGERVSSRRLYTCL